MAISKKIIFILFVSFLQACTPASQEPEEITIEDLTGLWNSSVNADVMYTRIDSNGDIIEYDFDGDAVDKGLNCYHIVSGTVKKIQGNQFLVSVDMFENESFSVELEMLDAGHALKVYFLDDGASQIWTRMSTDSILENEPACIN